MLHVCRVHFPQLAKSFLLRSYAFQTPVPWRFTTIVVLQLPRSQTCGFRQVQRNSKRPCLYQSHYFSRRVTGWVACVFVFWLKSATLFFPCKKKSTSTPLSGGKKRLVKKLPLSIGSVWFFMLAVSFATKQETRGGTSYGHPDRTGVCKLSSLW